MEIIDFISDNLVMWVIVAVCAFGFGKTLEASHKKGRVIVVKQGSMPFFGIALIALYGGGALFMFALSIRIVRLIWAL